MLKIKEDIYYVGAMNPSLRVFDIIMKTDFGTTYNAYLITGEKTALVETVHNKYKDVLFDSIKEICPIESIDYIIMNHTEPDHSGSIADIVEINPDVQVVGSAAAIKNIKSIINRDFNSITVKTGDSIDLGKGLKLDFISAPNLHWPDSIFTYVESRKMVFTCDVLGSHYCEPRIKDDVIIYPEAYESAFWGYFSAIFGPFKKFVIAGLDKLDKLDFDTVGTSHGPVLKEKVKWAIEKYREWSTPKEVEKNVAIFYVSAYGYTRTLAKTFESEINKLGIKAKAYDIIKYEPAVIAKAMEESSAVMFGSPTINRDALKPVWDTISSIDAISAKGKPCFVFGSYGWSGEACKALEERLKTLGLKVPFEGLRVLFKPEESDIIKAKEIAADFIKEI